MLNSQTGSYTESQKFIAAIVILRELLPHDSVLYFIPHHALLNRKKVNSRPQWPYLFFFLENHLPPPLTPSSPLEVHYSELYVTLVFLLGITCVQLKCLKQLMKVHRHKQEPHNHANRKAKTPRTHHQYSELQINI